MNFVSQFHKELEVEVFKENKIGRAFYEKYGFKKIDEYIHDVTGNKILRMNLLDS